jgi:hypothetical protein
MKGAIMMCLNHTHSDGEAMPDWEIYLRDGFGRPGEPIGGVTALVYTAEEALQAFLAFAPELSPYPLVAVRSTIAPPWTVYEWA